jgi:hypothetical protein
MRCGAALSVCGQNAKVIAAPVRALAISFNPTMAVART